MSLDGMADKAPGSLIRFPGGGPGKQGSAPIRLGFAAEPIIDLIHFNSGVLYHECLARLLVAEDRLVKGGEFIDELERNGAVGLLDVAMLGLVLDALENDPCAQFGCNISPRTLADRLAWDDFVRRIADRPSLAPRLTLEITESAPLDEIAEAPARLRALRSLGCRLALDDFGAGFATGERLRRVGFDWDVVKLDRSCLGDLRKTPSARGGLRSLLALAACHAPVVVVEGIETKEHLAVAREAGARLGQGWLFRGTEPGRWTIPDERLGARLAVAAAAHCAPSPENRGQVDPAVPAGDVLPAAIIVHLMDRARLAQSALRRRFEVDLSPAELDRVLVHYLYGLVTAALPEGAPRERLSLLCQLGEPVLERDALTCALHARVSARPFADERYGGIQSIFAAAETIGGRDAAALIDPSLPTDLAKTIVANGPAELASGATIHSNLRID